MKNLLEKYLLNLYKKYGVTPDTFTYIRIFSAPWLALLISKILSDRNLTLTIITLLIYAFVIMTSVFDGILARAISKSEPRDHYQGGMLDKISDKILIIFMLIPFGFNLFTFLIIGAESVLAFQAIYASNDKKQPNRTGKIKMILQMLLIPVLLLQVTTNLIPEMAVYGYIILTIIFTYTSIYSHLFYFKKEKNLHY